MPSTSPTSNRLWCTEYTPDTTSARMNAISQGLGRFTSQMQGVRITRPISSIAMLAITSPAYRP